MKRLLLALVTIFLITANACTLTPETIDAIHEHYDAGNYVYDCPDVIPCPETTPCPACPKCPEPVVEPRVVVEGYGRGTLWKPVAEHSPNLVVLIRKGYSKTFDRCFVYRGGREDDLECKGWDEERKRWTPGVCFSNGERQTWRADFTCDRADSVKVTCKLGADTFIFEKPGADPCGRHE